MKKKLPTPLKDGLIGAAMGTAAIVPGISGGTIAFVFGVFQKIVDALGVFFSKKFFKSLLVLLPFLIGAVIAILALITPFQLAFKYCLFAIVCLFVGFIVGSLPGVVDEIRGEKLNWKRILLLIIGFCVAAIIGVLSVKFKFNAGIDTLFAEKKWYFYFVLVGIGIIGAMGFIVPGFSGSMMLMVIGFYEPVLGLFDLSNLLPNVPALLCLAVGAAGGIVLCSKILSKLFKTYRVETILLVIGFIVGSIVSIYVNADMFAYFKPAVETDPHFNTLDMILSPIFLAVGFVIAYLLVRYTRKHPEIKNAEN